jgi:hypothetical protein
VFQKHAHSVRGPEIHGWLPGGQRGRRAYSSRNEFCMTHSAAKGQS